MKVKVLSSLQFACLFFLVISSVLDTVWKTKVLANKCSKAKIIEPLSAVKTNWKHYGQLKKIVNLSKIADFNDFQAAGVADYRPFLSSSKTFSHFGQNFSGSAEEEQDGTSRASL